MKLPSLAVLALSASAFAGTLDLDGGLRASIWNDNYKLGYGAVAGLIYGMGKFDAGLHLNYSRFTHKAATAQDENEYGGYLAFYLKPSPHEGMSFRLGPHAGVQMIDDVYLDLAVDAQVNFAINDKTQLYGQFSPGYLLIGPQDGGIFRIVFGVEYHLSD